MFGAKDKGEKKMNLNKVKVCQMCGIWKNDYKALKKQVSYRQDLLEQNDKELKDLKDWKNKVKVHLEEVKLWETCPDWMKEEINELLKGGK